MVGWVSITQRPRPQLTHVACMYYMRVSFGYRASTAAVAKWQEGRFIKMFVFAGFSQNKTEMVRKKGW